MKGLWSTIQVIFSLVGGWLGWFLGGMRRAFIRADRICCFRLCHGAYVCC